MSLNETNHDPRTLALSALAWILGEETRAERLLALTGITPDDLRERLEDPVLLAAIIRFLEAHEPDLLACADALSVPADRLVSVRRQLEDS